MPLQKSTKIKILVIRFSSIGDVIQALSIPPKLNEIFPHAEIHWITRGDLAPILNDHPLIHQIHPFNRKDGFWGLIKAAWRLRNENFTHIYDAHNNLRSRVLCAMLSWGNWHRVNLLRRSIKRWQRFLLFRFRINTFPKPFSGQRDLLEPLISWGASLSLPAAPQFFLRTNELAHARALLPWQQFIALAPSAAFFLKRWPKDYWIELIQSFPEKNFVLLGGPHDAFLEDIVNIAPQRVVNLAGKTNLRQSAAIIALSQILVSNDTGMLHFAEQLGHSCIALMGPAPFGFPSRPSTEIMELNLACRPCSKHGQGPCKNKHHFHQCLVDIYPAVVKDKILQRLETSLSVSSDKSGPRQQPK